MELRFRTTIPDLLAGKVKVSDPYQNYNANRISTSFGVDVNFPEIQLKKTLKSSDLYLLRGKLEETLRGWEMKYQRHIDTQHKKGREISVNEMNHEAKEATEILHGILKHALDFNEAIDWDVIKRKDAYRTSPDKLFSDGVAPDYMEFDNYGCPISFTPMTLPPEPTYTQIVQHDIVPFPPEPTYVQIKNELPACPTLEKVRSEYSFFSNLFRASAIKADFEHRVSETIKTELEKRRVLWRKEVLRIKEVNSNREVQYKAELEKRRAEINNRVDLWRKEVERINKENSNREIEFKEVTEVFENMKATFEDEKLRDNKALEDIKLRYKDTDSRAVEEYCDLVLDHSEYPDYFPKSWDLEYRVDSRMVVVEYDLPSPEQLPTIQSYKYVKTKDEITEKHRTEPVQKKLYDSIIYQVCIRTIHELFEADVVNALDAVAFNGLVTRNNPATGIRETKVIMSVLAGKSEFTAFDLSQIVPRDTFKHLKGVAAATLINVTPIPPIIKLDKTDKRFIEGKDVAYQLDESVNIAAMDWQDFEYLIRELFEKEFATDGGEVKVTQASADGGVDAIAFDPDPIRGGKIVIQAKRYTNTVGVAAVRDLFGTVQHEGAIKGILVTTADYGRDSHEFAKGKPLTLLNGSNLLALLEKHGHKARINTQEAKKILNM